MVKQLQSAWFSLLFILFYKTMEGQGDGLELVVDSGVSTNVERNTVRSFSQFTPNRILSEDLQKKTICIEGKVVGDESPALVVLEQIPFTEDSLKDLLSVESVLNVETLNDVYGRYECVPVVKLRGVKTTFIHPATQEDIKKYESHPVRIALETPQLYSDVILPHISCSLNLQWVYDILEKKSKDKILYEDNSSLVGFTVIPHLSWVDDDINELHVVAIVRRKDIKSLRDLTGDHIFLLKNIQDNATKFIEERYGICSSRLVAFINYHPSYYHLHIHFANVSCQDLGNPTEKSHLLSEVIDNIELMSDYYQKTNLSFIFNPLDSWICEQDHPHLSGLTTNMTS